MTDLTMGPDLGARDVGVRYASELGEKTALQDVTLRIPGGTCTALVGESGSGKTTLGRAFAGRLPSTAVVTGELDTASRAVYMSQDAMSALNPLRDVAWQLDQVLKHRGVRRGHREGRRLELLTAAGCPNPDDLLRKHPHELSGGLAQRVVLATVLATDPQALVVDEPTSALDVTTGARVMASLRALVDERGLTLVVITHDLRAAQRMADRIAVLHRGRLVEHGTAEEVVRAPQHGYTRALVSASAAGLGPAARRPALGPRTVDREEAGHVPA